MTTPTFTDAVVLVTGANGGLGTEFVRQALARGAAKVYATARTPREWPNDRVVPLRLDVVDPESVRAAAAVACDVTIVVNNAGVAPPSTALLDTDDADLRRTMEVNFFGPVAVARAFAPVLVANSPSALVDVHSALSWYAIGGAYSASKAALWSATNSFRLDLASRGVQVTGVHMGWVDTPMAHGVEGPKLAPADLVAAAYDAVEAGEFEVIADAITAAAKSGLSGPIETLYPQLAR